MFITKKEYERRVEKAVYEALERRNHDQYQNERFNDIERRITEIHKRLDDFGQAAQADSRNLWKSIEEIFEKFDAQCAQNT